MVIVELPVAVSMPHPQFGLNSVDQPLLTSLPPPAPLRLWGPLKLRENLPSTTKKLSPHMTIISLPRLLVIPGQTDTLRLHFRKQTRPFVILDSHLQRCLTAFQI